MADRIVAATLDSVTNLIRGTDSKWRASRMLPHVDARCLATDPLNRLRVYAGGESAGLYTSEDGGLNWISSPVQPPSPNIFSIAVSALERSDGFGTIYVGTEPSALYKSEDGGETWVELDALTRIPSAPTWSFPPRPWTSHVRTIALSPHDRDLIIAGIELGGVMRSDDGGETWSDHAKGAYKDCHALAMSPDRPGLVYEAAGGGAAVSTDAGITWTPIDEGMDRHYVYSMAVDYDNPDLVYVGASVDAAHAHYMEDDADAAIYRRMSDGSWEAVNGLLGPPLPQFPYALATHPDEPGALYVGFGDGTLAISLDYGDNWDRPEINGDRPKEIQAMVVY